MLSVGIIHGDDGVPQHALFGHGAQPDYTSGGFFGAADDVRQQLLPLGMQHVHQIGAIIHGQVRPMVGRCRDVRIVDIVALAFDGVDRDAVIPHQRRRHVILRG